MNARPIPRAGLPRWPAVSMDGTAMGPRVIGCACHVEGDCARADCPHRPEEERHD